MGTVRKLLWQLETRHINRAQFQVALATLRLRERIEDWEAREGTYQAALLSNGQRRHRKAVA